MGFRNLIITQHAHLTYQESNLIVQTANGINAVPITDLNLVLIDSLQVVIDSYVINALNAHTVQLIFVDESHQPACVLTSVNFNQHYVVNLQQQIQWSDQRKGTVWSKIVLAKISMQNQALNWSGYDNELQTEIDQLQFNDVMNREAVAARKYFPLLFDQTQFNRRDPANHINAILNYGYAVLLAMVDKEIVSHGYVTCLGIHHINDQNLYNLGSDLMEPFRPVIDFWISSHQLTELTREVKYSLVGLMNVVINYNDRQMTLTNAISTLVSDSLAYLSQQRDDLTIKVGLSDEVTHYAVIDHV